MNSDLARLHDFASRYTAAWCSHDPASVAAFFAPNGSLKINDAAKSVGRTAVTEAARGFMTAFPDLKISMDQLLLVGPRVQYHWTLTGTYSGPGGQGHRVRISGYEEWKFSAENLIEDSLGHFDAADYQQQIAHGFQG